MADILLVTLNARWTHASLGLRYLHANLGALQPRAKILEFVTGAKTEALAERILDERPLVVGFGVYIWNVEETTRLVAALKTLAPELAVVVGGPEVSFETDAQRICRLADHVITGAADTAFAALCERILDWKDGRAPRPLTKVIPAPEVEPDSLELPYGLYTGEDIAHRTLYVEASRGCPFKCEFCLSSLDRTAVPFDTGRFLDELGKLHARGARLFKFVDRTFNLKVSTSLAILGFFLERLEASPDDPVFAHFELVPDHLPEKLRAAILRFPPGTLQFEIGIQTWNPEVQKLISRRQDDDAAEANIRWLAAETNAHLHVDLIAGLPGEDLASFGRGFDRLWRLGPHEIQVGILKRLRGAPIARHTEAWGLRFNPDPPYNVLATAHLPFRDVQRVSRFARYWDLVANSGRFPRSLPRLLGDAPFERFMALSDWLYRRTDATHRISPERLAALLAEWAREACADGELAGLLAADAQGASPGRGHPPRRGAAPERQARFAAHGDAR